MIGNSRFSLPGSLYGQILAETCLGAPVRNTFASMVRRIVKGAVVGLSIAVAWTGAAPAQALAEEPPETPPAAFVPPPPDHQPGSSEYVPGSEKEPRPVVPDDGLPGFLTLDRVGTTSHAGIQMGFHKFDDVSLSDGFAMRFNPYGQFMFPNRKAGIYGQLPISHAFALNGDPDGTGVGNLELGGLFLPMSDSRLILRAGLALATASDDDALDAGANLATAFERITDLLLVVPEYTTLRLSASTVHQMDMFFFRLDGGFDFVIARPGTADGPSVIFRANAAGGVRTQFVDFSLELANLAFLNGVDDGDDRFIHTAAIGARTRGENQFHFGAVFPLDEEIRGEIWILSLAYMRAFN
jgi:hypothetical protein